MSVTVGVVQVKNFSKSSSSTGIKTELSSSENLAPVVSAEQLRVRAKFF